MTESLCRACGLCCDGTLFARVPVAADEIATMSELGFAIIQGTHPAYFAQPCTQHAGGSCSAYSSRPENCRSFGCRVLQRQEAGELSLEDALILVRKAISLGSTVARQRLLEAEFKPSRLPGDEL